MVRSGNHVDAVYMMMRMFNTVICDDHLLNCTAEETLQRSEGVDSDFLNAVLCLYGGRYEQGIIYAEQVIQACEDCKEAFYVKSRCLAALGRWQEADVVNEQISDLVGKLYLRDLKALYHWSRVNHELGQECDNLLKAILKRHPGYKPAQSLLDACIPPAEDNSAEEGNDAESAKIA